MLSIRARVNHASRCECHALQCPQRRQRREPVLSVPYLTSCDCDRMVSIHSKAKETSTHTIQSDKFEK